MNVMLMFQWFDCFSIMFGLASAIIVCFLYALAGHVQSTESSNHLQIAQVRRAYLLTNSLDLVATHVAKLET